MLPGEASTPSNRVKAALALIPDAESEDGLDAHVRWELKEVLSRLKYDDLTTSEVMALLAILCPAHSRVIRLRSNVGVDTGAVLHIIHD